MLVNILCLIGGFVICLCLPNVKYNKVKAEFDELKEKVKDKLDGDDDVKADVKDKAPE